MTTPTTIKNTNPPTTPSCCLNLPSNCRVESETPHPSAANNTTCARFTSRWAVVGDATRRSNSSRSSTLNTIGAALHIHPDYTRPNSETLH